jgi:hypothetical protein
VPQRPYADSERRNLLGRQEHEDPQDDGDRRERMPLDEGVEPEIRKSTKAFPRQGREVSRARAPLATKHRCVMPELAGGQQLSGVQHPGGIEARLDGAQHVDPQLSDLVG